jgi:hypothetical protein
MKIKTYKPKQVNIEKLKQYLRTDKIDKTDKK